MTEVVKAAPMVPAPASTGQSLAELMELARVMAVSSLLPQALKGKPSDVLITVMYGQELGLSPMQAIQSVYVVNGRPTISAQLWVALARRAGHKVRVVDEQPESCTVEVERADDLGHPTRVTYTLDQAKAAKLTGKDVWTGHRAAMLYARAVSTACRRACPEIALGFGDETEREPSEPERPNLAQVAAQRTDKPADPEPAAAEVSDAEIADAYEQIEREATTDEGQGLRPDDPDLFAHEQEGGE